MAPRTDHANGEWPCSSTQGKKWSEIAATSKPTCSARRACRRTRGVVLFGHEFVAKLEHLQFPLLQGSFWRGRSSPPFQTTEQPVTLDESSDRPAALCAAASLPLLALGNGAEARQQRHLGCWVLWMACDSQLRLSPLTRAHIPRKRGDRAPQPRKRRPTARWSSRDHTPTNPAPCFSNSPYPANLGERQ